MKQVCRPVKDSAYTCGWEGYRIFSYVKAIKVCGQGGMVAV